MIGTIPTGFIGIGNNDDCCAFHCFAYIIGISFIDLIIRIDRRTSTSTIINMKAIIPQTLVDDETLPYTC
jgi:hypothetical protein